MQNKTLVSLLIVVAALAIWFVARPDLARELFAIGGV